MTATPVPVDRLLTIDEAVEVCRMPLGSLRWHRTNGTGPRFFRLGRRIVVKESQLWEWIEQRAQADRHAHDAA